MYNNSLVDAASHSRSEFQEKRPVASALKVAVHKNRVMEYIQGGQIYPITLELDLTSRCNRSCPDCPSTRARQHDYLSLGFVKKLFAALDGKTPGLLLTGGEPTMAPLFPEVLAMAKAHGFKNIGVVTNGSNLDQPKVYEALIAHASTIRVSMYDFNSSSCEGIETTLKRVKKLRGRIDQFDSPLQIGISTLTSKERIPVLKKIAEAVRASGAHWLYFHPMCEAWASGAPVMINQDGVIEEIENLTRQHKNSFNVSYSPERYEASTVDFSGYHGAHFLMIVGADGKNYLGAEVKYHPSFAIADLKDNLEEGFLWDADRQEKISSVTSDTYGAIGSRHRGGLYSHLIQELVGNKNGGPSILDEELNYNFPYIL